jgi:hypothetical protein
VALNQPSGGAELFRVGGGAGSVQRGGALESSERRRGEADLRRGSELEPRRQNRAKAVRVKFSAVGGFARLANDAARCSRRCRFGAPDRAKHQAHQKFYSTGADRAPTRGPNLSPYALYQWL